MTAANSNSCQLAARHVAAGTTDFRRPLISGAPWVVGGRMVGSIAALFASGLLARALGPADFGHFLYLQSIIYFSLELGKFGLDRALLRYISMSFSAGDAVAISTIRQRCLLLAVLTATLTGSLAAVVVLTTGSRAATVPEAIAVCLGCVFTTLLLLNAESLRGLHDLRWSTVLGAQRTGPAFAFLFLGFSSLFYAGGGYGGAPVAIGAAVMITAVLAMLSQRIFTRLLKHVPSTTDDVPRASLPSLPDWSGLLVSSTTLITADLLNSCWEYGELFIVSWVLDRQEIASYGAALQLVVIVVIPIQLGLQVVRAHIPSMYTNNQLAELQEMLRGLTGLVLVATSVPLAVLAFAAKPILVLAYGPEFANAAPVLQILLVGRVAMLLTGTAQSVLLFTGQERSVLFANGISVVVLIACVASLGPSFGVVGVAVGTSLARTVAQLLYWLLAFKICRVHTLASPRAALAWLKR